jgi:hypothetical protein
MGINEPGQQRNVTQINNPRLARMLDRRADGLDAFILDQDLRGRHYSAGRDID